MKRIYNYLLILVVPVVLLLFYAGTESSSGSPGGKTGSPGDNGQNCTGCHIGTPVQQDMWIFIPELLPNQGYIPGTQYQVVVFGAREGAGKFGFEATAENENGQKTGTLELLDPIRTKFTNNNKAVTHTPTGSIAVMDTTAWFFYWTAPSESEGAITLYAAVNGANGNGANSGDIINLSSFTVSPGVGVNDNKASEFTVYPNPATSFISVSNAEGKAEIINSSGSVVMTLDNPDITRKIDITGLAKGLYFVRTNDKMVKFLKN